MASTILDRRMDLVHSYDMASNTHYLMFDTSYPINVGGVVTKTFKATHGFEFMNIDTMTFKICKYNTNDVVLTIPTDNILDFSGKSVFRMDRIRPGGQPYYMYYDGTDTSYWLFLNNQEVTCVIDFDNAKIYICSENIYERFLQSTLNESSSGTGAGHFDMFEYDDTLDPMESKYPAITKAEQFESKDVQEDGTLTYHAFVREMISKVVYQIKYTYSSNGEEGYDTRAILTPVADVDVVDMNDLAITRSQIWPYDSVGLDTVSMMACNNVLSGTFTTGFNSSYSFKYNELVRESDPKDGTGADTLNNSSPYVINSLTRRVDTGYLNSIIDSNGGRSQSTADNPNKQKKYRYLVLSERPETTQLSTLTDVGYTYLIPITRSDQPEPNSINVAFTSNIKPICNGYNYSLSLLRNQNSYKFSGYLHMNGNTPCLSWVKNYDFPIMGTYPKAMYLASSNTDPTYTDNSLKFQPLYTLKSLVNTGMVPGYYAEYSTNGSIPTTMNQFYVKFNPTTGLIMADMNTSLYSNFPMKVNDYYKTWFFINQLIFFSNGDAAYKVFNINSAFQMYDSIYDSYSDELANNPVVNDPDYQRGSGSGKFRYMHWAGNPVDFGTPSEPDSWIFKGMAGNKIFNNAIYMPERICNLLYNNTLEGSYNLKSLTPSTDPNTSLSGDDWINYYTYSENIVPSTIYLYEQDLIYRVNLLSDIAVRPDIMRIIGNKADASVTSSNIAKQGFNDGTHDNTCVSIISKAFATDPNKSGSTIVDANKCTARLDSDNFVASNAINGWISYDYRTRREGDQDIQYINAIVKNDVYCLSYPKFIGYTKRTNGSRALQSDMYHHKFTTSYKIYMANDIYNNPPSGSSGAAVQIAEYNDPLVWYNSTDTSDTNKYLGFRSFTTGTSINKNEAMFIAVKPVPTQTTLSDGTVIWYNKGIKPTSYDDLESQTFVTKEWLNEYINGYISHCQGSGHKKTSKNLIAPYIDLFYHRNSKLFKTRLFFDIDNSAHVDFTKSEYVTVPIDVTNEYYGAYMSGFKPGDPFDEDITYEQVGNPMPTNVKFMKYVVYSLGTYFKSWPLTPYQSNSKIERTFGEFTGRYETVFATAGINITYQFANDVYFQHVSSFFVGSQVTNVINWFNNDTDTKPASEYKLRDLTKDTSLRTDAKLSNTNTNRVPKINDIYGIPDEEYNINTYDSILRTNRITDIIDPVQLKYINGVGMKAEYYKDSKDITQYATIGEFFTNLLRYDVGITNGEIVYDIRNNSYISKLKYHLWSRSNIVKIYTNNTSNLVDSQGRNLTVTANLESTSEVDTTNNLFMPTPLRLDQMNTGVEYKTRYLAQDDHKYLTTVKTGNKTVYGLALNTNVLNPGNVSDDGSSGTIDATGVNGSSIIRALSNNKNIDILGSMADIKDDFNAEQKLIANVAHDIETTNSNPIGYDSAIAPFLKDDSNHDIIYLEKYNKNWSSDKKSEYDSLFTSHSDSVEVNNQGVFVIETKGAKVIRDSDGNFINIPGTMKLQRAYLSKDDYKVLTTNPNCYISGGGGGGGGYDYSFPDMNTEIHEGYKEVRHNIIPSPRTAAYSIGPNWYQGATTSQDTYFGLSITVPRLRYDENGHIVTKGDSETNYSYKLPNLSSSDGSITFSRDASTNTCVLTHTVSHNSGNVGKGNGTTYPTTIPNGGSFEVPWINFDENGHIKTWGSTVMHLPASPSSLPSGYTTDSQTGIVLGDSKIVSRSASTTGGLYIIGNADIVSTSSRKIDRDFTTGILMSADNSSNNSLRIDPITKAIYSINAPGTTTGSTTKSDMGYRFSIQLCKQVNAFDLTVDKQFRVYSFEYAIIYDKVVGKVYANSINNKNIYVQVCKGNLRHTEIGDVYCGNSYVTGHASFTDLTEKSVQTSTLERLRNSDDSTVKSAADNFFKQKLQLITSIQTSSNISSDMLLLVSTTLETSRLTFIHNNVNTQTLLIGQGNDLSESETPEGLTEGWSSAKTYDAKPYYE